MSTGGTHSGSTNRWIGWRLPAQKFADSAKGKPTKPSKPGSVGFVGAPYAENAIILSPPGGPKRSLARPYRPALNGAQPIQMDLDCSPKTTRLMSWSGRTAAATEWRGGVIPAKAES